MTHPLHGQTAMDPERWLAGFTAQAQALQAQAEDAQARLAANQATVENKLVRMTLTSSGAIADIMFKPDAGRAAATELTAAFLEVYREGSAIVARETRSVLASLAGPDDPSLAAFDQAVPEQTRAAMAEQDNRP